MREGKLKERIKQVWLDVLFLGKERNDSSKIWDNPKCNRTQVS